MHLSGNCKQSPVDYPALVKREDLAVRGGKWAAVASEANQRIEDGNACQDAQALLYGGGEK